MTIEALAKQGRANYTVSMAASVASKVYEARKKNIRDSFTDFQTEEHRLEMVAKVHGIEFINDSKASNINSTWFALEKVSGPIVWIVGGQDKNNEYEILQQLAKQKVKAIVCLGKDNSRIIKSFKNVVPAIVETNNAKDAVTAAYYLGETGDTVLFSPACPSFDLFESFEDRGKQFKAAVNEL